MARQDLESIYSFKKALHSSFEKTKSEMKSDYSKIITNQIQHENISRTSFDPFLRLTAVFFFMVTCIVAGLIKFLYF